MAARRHRFGGLAGVKFHGLPLTLGPGITISETYASLQAPLLVNFDPSKEPGLPKPPWMTTEGGGISFIISAEIEISETFEFPQKGLTDLALLWWLVCLLRLRASSVLFMPLMSDESFSSPKTLPQRTSFRPFEIRLRRRVPESSPRLSVESDDLAWLQSHWRGGLDLMASSKPFNLLILALDAASLASPEDRGLELLSLWGALESMFAPARAELRFRVSALIATYLEQSGPARRQLQQRIMKLYDARSKLAHTGDDSDYNEVAETYALSRRIAVRILEEKEVPTLSGLEDRLFGS